MADDYYIGLDMGTSSVGWAVTDPEYRLIRINGKDAWGVRLFEEGKTSADRRLSRGSRRRIDREQARLRYVRRMLQPLVDQVDLDFYQRRKESMLWEDDKSSKEKYSIFGKDGMSDSEFYRLYPTISHLITDMIDHPEKHTDPREYALVIEHKFKHRGNFLQNKEMKDTDQTFDELYTQMLDRLNEAVFQSDDPDSFKDRFPRAEDVAAVLSDREKTVTDKKSALTKLLKSVSSGKSFSAEELKKIQPAFGLLCGKEEDLFSIWPDHPMRSEEMKNCKISLRNKSLEEAVNAFADQFSEEEMELLEGVSQIYDWSCLENLMKDRKGNTYKFLAASRVGLYEDHKADLKQLKMLLKTTDQKLYNEIFRSYSGSKEKNKVTYSDYVGSVNSTKAGKIRGKKISQDLFYERLKKVLNNLDFSKLSEDKRKWCEEQKEDILRKISLGEFLPKQMSSKNGVIPNQLHLKELRKILENAEQIFPVFLDKDETGLTLSERLCSLFSYRIPYYIGPLGQGAEQGTSWVVWKDGQNQGKVYPWDIEDKIDMKATSRAFISRMVRPCTYLPDQKVLPDHSLIYEKFKVLNELNNLKIDGEPLPVHLKQELYETVFSKGKAVTEKKLRKFLVDSGLMDPEQAGKAVISGIDQGFTNKLGTEKFFCEVFGTDRLSDQQRSMAENIVYWSTVYEEGGKLLKEEIQSAYPELTDKQIRRILGNRFSGWGRCSREFFALEGTDQNGCSGTVMDFLWNTNDNLMQILSEKYSFRQTVSERTAGTEKSLFEVNHDDLDDLYLSGPVKRMIWQTIRILREIVEMMGRPPKKVFIEMARGPEEKGKRTVSRKAKFKELYKSIHDDSHNWATEIDKLDEQLFWKKKLYLYLTQQGKDAYTGESVDLDELLHSNSNYDIDHIYAQRWVKDDSLENNLVLTNKKSNSGKKDRFPIDPEIQKKMQPTWKFWLEKGLITQEKYDRLMRKTGFTDEELAGFINRQLVETRQGTKVLASMIRQTSPETKVVYSKASNVSDFRKMFDIPKLRYLNNLHHAVDAYLNIVVGNVYSVQFTDNPLRYIQELDSARTYSLKKLYERKVSRGKETAWIPESNGTISAVKKVVFKGTPLVTYRAVPGHGAISEINLSSAKTKEISTGTYFLPRKTDTGADPAKYGYYDSVFVSSYFLVEYRIKQKKGSKSERILLPLTIADSVKYHSKEDLEKYCQDVLGLDSPSVRWMNIHPKSLLRINGYPMQLLSRTEDRLRMASTAELVIPEHFQLYLMKTIQVSEDGSFRTFTKVLSKEENIKLFDLLIRKFETGLLHAYPHKAKEKPICDSLECSRDAFMRLTEAEQLEVLVRIIRSFSTGLDELKTSFSAFRYLPDPRITNKIFGWEKLAERNNQNAGEVILVLPSVTGLTSKEIDLVQV